MKQPDLETLSTVFENVFDNWIGPLTAETTQKDVPGWDSLAHVTLIIDLEITFSVKFTSEEIGRMTSVKDITAIIRSKG